MNQNICQCSTMKIYSKPYQQIMDRFMLQFMKFKLICHTFVNPNQESKVYDFQELYLFDFFTLSLGRSIDSHNYDKSYELYANEVYIYEYIHLSLTKSSIFFSIFRNLI